nr:reverse transcriptase domain, reverse transcriptase zinc-binding domain protein [Tanacetum cinerariifolium]
MKKEAHAIVNELVEKGLGELGLARIKSSSIIYNLRTIPFFEEWNTKNARALVTILRCFEAVSGLRVNFNKSKLYEMGASDEELGNMANGMGCDIACGDFGGHLRGVRDMKEEGVWHDIVMYGIEIGGLRDRWRWSFDVEGEFKVKMLTGLIEEKILQVKVGGQDTLWNK